MNGNLINNFSLAICVRALRHLFFFCSHSNWVSGQNHEGTATRFSREIPTMSQDENVNIHYISGLKAFGLEGLRKLPALIEDTGSKTLSLISVTGEKRASYHLCKGEENQIFSSHSSSILEPRLTSLLWFLSARKETFHNTNIDIQNGMMNESSNFCLVSKCCSSLKTQKIQNQKIQHVVIIPFD